MTTSLFGTQTLLVIAAHPDDEVIGVGGTIAKLSAAGVEVQVCVLTEGSSAQYPGQPELQQRKREQMRKANELLGTSELVELDFPDMRLDTVPHLELNDALQEVINRRPFDTLLVHHGSDVNLDHQLAHLSARVVSRPYPGQTIRRLLSYHTNSATEWGGRRQNERFCPNYFVDIESTMETKISAMRCYADEVRAFPHPRSLEALEHRAAVWGSESGFRYAEAFEILFARD